MGTKYLLTFPLFLGILATVCFCQMVWSGKKRSSEKKQKKKSCTGVCGHRRLVISLSVCGVGVRKVGCCGDEWHLNRRPLEQRQSRAPPAYLCMYMR